jgi:hypothetical protein
MLLIVELDGFDLWWRRNDRIDSWREIVPDMLMGALVSSAMMGMKGNIVQMMVAAMMGMKGNIVETMVVPVSCMVDFFWRGWVRG